MLPNGHAHLQLVPVQPGPVQPGPVMHPPSALQVLQQILDGTIHVHPSKANVTKSQIVTQICNIQRGNMLHTGPNGGWSVQANAALYAWLTAAKRMRPVPALALPAPPVQALAALVPALLALPAPAPDSDDDDDDDDDDSEGEESNPEEDSNPEENNSEEGEENNPGAENIKDVRLIPQAIESWESRRAVMENEFGERLSDRMAAAIVTAMLPLEFQDMIYQAQGAKEVVYSEVRDKVLSVAGCRIQAAQPTPMDVGAVTKTEQGDTWGDETAVEADRVNEEINQIKGNGKGTQCYRCGGYGHMARTCGTPAVKGEPKGKGKGHGDDGKGGKGYGKESTECYNCGKKGHLSKDCWSVKGKGKGKGKDVNEMADAAVEVGGVWMIAGVEEASLTPLQVNEMWRQNSLTPTQISNYWDDIWSETEDEEELDAGPPTMVNSPDHSDDEGDGDVIEGPPGIVNFCGTWEQTESLNTPLVEKTISKFDMLFRRPEETEEEFEVIEDSEEIGGVSTEYPSANGELFDWDELDGRPEICGVFEINAVESKVKIAIDSAAAESVCPFGWAEQFAVTPCAPGQEQSFVNASGGPIKQFGEQKVALLTKGSSGQDRTIGLPFQACDVKRPRGVMYWRTHVFVTKTIR